jgi:hypothetical protein
MVSFHFGRNQDQRPGEPGVQKSLDEITKPVNVSKK